MNGVTDLKPYQSDATGSFGPIPEEPADCIGSNMHPRPRDVLMGEDIPLDGMESTNAAPSDGLEGTLSQNIDNESLPQEIRVIRPNPGRYAWGAFLRKRVKIRTKMLGLGLAVIAALSGCNMEDKRVSGGFEYWNFSGIEHRHMIYGQDDYSHGDCGKTEISSGYFFNINMKQSLGDGQLNPYATAGLLAGYAREIEREENRYGPPTAGAYIYSSIFPVAPQLGIGIESEINEKAKLGVEATGTLFWVSHGYDRSGKTHPVEQEAEPFYNIGPVLNLRTGEDSGLRLKAAFGSNKALTLSILLTF